MKKIIVLAALFFGLVSYAQVPIYIYNTTGSDAAISVKATGSYNSNCEEHIVTEIALMAGTSIVLNNFDDSPGHWILTSPWQFYTGAEAVSAYGLADWVSVAFRPRNGTPTCPGMYAPCGAEVGDGDCGVAGPEYIPGEGDCCTTAASWADYGTYIVVTFYVI